MAHIEVGRGMLAYDEAGSGPAVIMIHGGLADRRLWDGQFAHLAQTYRTIRYDWRGYGESSDPDGELAHHEDLLSLMDALDVEHAALVGNSYGGAFAVDAALSAPERVTSLALICSGLSGHDWPPEMIAQAQERIHRAVPAERLRRYRERTAGQVSPIDVDAMAEAQLRFMAVGPERDVSALPSGMWEKAMAMCRHVFGRDWNNPAPARQRWLQPPAKGRLAEIQTPTLVVNGLADVPYIQEVSRLLAEGIEGAKLVNLPDTGHLPPLERPDEVTRLLTEHLAGTSLARSERTGS